MRRADLALWALFALIVLTYAPSLGGGFVWDDVFLIERDPALRTFSGAWNAAFSDFFGRNTVDSIQTGYLRPLPTLLNAATLALFGVEPLPFRLTNLGLHLANVGLVFGLLRRLKQESLPALVGAAAFGLHPVQTEAVAFISARTDLLAGLFSLLSVHGYLSARRGGRLWALSGAGSVGALALGLLSKEVTLGVLPVLGGLEALGLVNRGRRWLLGIHLATAAALILPRLLGGLPGQAAPEQALGLLGLYGRLVVWPVELRALYDHLALPSSGLGLACLLAVGALVALAWVKRSPVVGLGALAFLCFLAPVLHLVPLKTLAAERYLYLPLMGVGLALAGLTRPKLGRLARGLPLALAVGGALLSTARALDWHDERALWSAEASRPDPGAVTYLNLGTVLAEAGELPEARVLFARAYEARPGHPVIFRNLLRLHLMAPPDGEPVPPALKGELASLLKESRPAPAKLEALSRAVGPGSLSRLLKRQAAP